MELILSAVLVLGAIALVAALVLFGVSKKFAVEEDPRLGQVGELPPVWVLLRWHRQYGNQSCRQHPNPQSRDG